METARPVEATEGDADVQRLLKLRVPVNVRLAGKKMSVESIAKLTVGTIVEFESSAEGELDLKIGDKTIGFGRAVKIGENFGLRISSMVDVRETINALRGR